jgi:hypothetical protein
VKLNTSDDLVLEEISAHNVRLVPSIEKGMYEFEVLFAKENPAMRIPDFDQTYKNNQKNWNTSGQMEGL